MVPGRFTVAAALALLPGILLANPRATQAVFVMTNDADKNEVIAYQRDDSGALGEARHFETRGRGSGGTIDPLASQGALTLSADGRWLYLVRRVRGADAPPEVERVDVAATLDRTTPRLASKQAGTTN